MTLIATPARRRLTLLAAGTLALGTLAVSTLSAGAQYSTPVGQGAAKPKTLRATAVLEWTGSLEKPSASRLMPIAIWDGEQYQPASLYLAKPEPLAFTAGTLYVLEHAGAEAGLFEVRTPAQLRGQWIGMGKFQPEAPPPPPKKLKASKQLPVLEGGKRDKDKPTTYDDRPTLHRAPGSGSPGAGSAPANGSGSGAESGNASGTPASSGDKPAPGQTSTTQKPSDDAPTLHRRTDAGAGGDAGSGTDASSPSKAPDVDPDRPTLHKPSDTSDPKPATGSDADADPDRPTLHRARTAGGLAAASTTIDPDRPRLRYGAPDESGESLMPAKLEGAPPAMQQLVAVSDAAAGEPQTYTYRWPDAGDAVKMQAALAQLAAQAVTAPATSAAAGKSSFGPQAAQARAAARSGKGQSPGRKAGAKSSPAPAGPALADEKFAAFELSFSGGATLVYSAHTVAEPANRVYVTLVAQPDFNGKPQVLFQQVSHANRLAETPAMQLVDAVDTDGDGRAELVFSLTGPSATTTVASAPGGGQPAESLYAADAAGPERQFAIYRVAGGRVQQVFATGPLP